MSIVTLPLVFALFFLSRLLEQSCGVDKVSSCVGTPGDVNKLFMLR